ncbi:bifunctional solanapyrone synthase [Podospora fimiseda]|uniref:Bifunctional solanapyrone synthase n=1 Tax=Podospora fimiseda TaxID=252190 RepID=A0AAN7BFK7_9PEZI|nr:bifunctional solanapyrone synthase [Podospora fimiseda]
MMSSINNPEILAALTSALGSNPASLSQPGTAEYENDNGSYYTAFANEVKPSFIAKPTTVEQVQSLVRILRPFVLAGSCQLAIRGAGHTPIASSVNIQDGITIDTRGLKGIVLSQDKSTVDISVGETWTTVYADLDRHGLSTAGGRVGRVGVPGFILGGGLSMVSSRRGFACDSVTEFKIVLASGELVRANADENTDLWVALKGGLNNFGIVTSITMTTFPATDIWGGITYFLPDTFMQIMSKACGFVNNEIDQDVHFMWSAGYGYGHRAVSCVMYHTQGKVKPPAIQSFLDVQPQIEQMSTIRTAKNSDFCEELGRFSIDGNRQYWATLTIKPDLDLINTFHERWEETLETIKDVEGLIFSLGFHPLTKGLLEASEKAGGNAMDIPPSDGPLFVILINPQWALSQDDSRIFGAVERMMGGFKQLAAEKGLLHRYLFTNYADKADDVMVGYGKESLERLKATSAKYDPEGVFQKGVPGGFKLV